MMYGPTLAALNILQSVSQADRHAADNISAPLSLHSATEWTSRRQSVLRLPQRGGWGGDVGRRREGQKVKFFVEREAADCDLWVIGWTGFAHRSGNSYHCVPVVPRLCSFKAAFFSFLTKETGGEEFCRHYVSKRKQHGFWVDGRDNEEFNYGNSGHKPFLERHARGPVIHFLMGRLNPIDPGATENARPDIARLDSVRPYNEGGHSETCYCVQV